MFRHFMTFSLVVMFALSATAQGPRTAIATPVDWKMLFQQLFYWNIAKSVDSNKTDLIHIYEHSMYYSPLDPNDVYQQIVSRPTSNDAFNTREKLMGFDNNRKFFEGVKANQLENVTGVNTLVNSAAGDLVRLLLEKHREKISPTKNYFTTELGQAVLTSLQDTLMVIVPGFGSHTIPDYTYPEIVEDVNTYYGRPRVRVARPVGGENVYVGENAPENFYKLRAGAPAHEFDIVHPMGYELGNSMGKDIDAADYLAKWIMNLPPEYANKKLVFIGYSKGTPIAHTVVQRNKAIRDRTRMIVTIAGVNQGSIAAQSGIDGLCKVTNSATPQEATAKLSQMADQGSALLATLLGPLAGVEMSTSSTLAPADQFLKSTGLVENLSGQLAQKLLETKENQKDIEGVIDLTNYERIKWNLMHLNDKDFDKPITIMNLSVVTNVKDFFLPGRVNDGDPMLLPPLTVPQLGASGTVNNSVFSRDDVFLHLTSITGFQQAPGGLFDTQVAWMDAKAMPLDHRSLLESLTAEQIGLLHNELIDKTGMGLPAGYLTMPRHQLLAAYNASMKNTMNDLTFINLGDVRGTHWDVAFRQVYKPKDGPYYKHSFPRRAALTALLETIAMYVKANEGGAK